MKNSVYNADELVYTVLKEKPKKKPLRLTNIKSWIVLIAVFSLCLVIKYCLYKVETLDLESSWNGCPLGYKYYGKTGACYKITTRAVSFKEAERSCESDGTHLASIHSKKEIDFLHSEYRQKLMEYLRSNVTSRQAKASFWIGLNFEDGVWQWSDGSEVDYVNWNWNLPGDQSLAAVIQTFSYDDSWWTVYEYLNFGFICKKQLRFSKKQRDMTSVQEPHSTTTATSKKSEMEEGLGMAVKVMGEFLKGVGSIAKAASEAEASRNIPKSTVPRTTPSLVLIQSDSADNKCTPGYTFFKETGFCYKVQIVPMSRTPLRFQVGMEELNFHDASQACLSEQAQLASIHSVAENDFLNMLYLYKYRDYIQNLNIYKDKKDPWIGLIYKSGNWEWTDGTPVDYTNWAIGEPNNLKQGGRTLEHWVTMVARKRPDWSPNGKEWNNCLGSDKLAYFCKKRVIPETTTTQTPVTTPLIVDDGNECPSGYRHFESFCYKVSIPAVTFEEAQKSCASEDAHLVSIHSSAENRFIPTLYNETLAEYRRKVNIMQANTSIWIGLYFRNKKWQWSDRSDVDFTNWAPERPNLLIKKLFNAIMVLPNIADSPYGDKWNNEAKGGKYGFVCKKKSTSGSEEGLE